MPTGSPQLMIPETNPVPKIRAFTSDLYDEYNPNGPIVSWLNTWLSSRPLSKRIDRLEFLCSLAFNVDFHSERRLAENLLSKYFGLELNIALTSPELNILDDTSEWTMFVKRLMQEIKNPPKILQLHPHLAELEYHIDGWTTVSHQHHLSNHPLSKSIRKFFTYHALRRMLQKVEPSTILHVVADTSVAGEVATFFQVSNFTQFKIHPKDAMPNIDDNDRILFIDKYDKDHTAYLKYNLQHLYLVHRLFYGLAGVDTYTYKDKAVLGEGAFYRHQNLVTFAASPQDSLITHHCPDFTHLEASGKISFDRVASFGNFFSITQLKVRPSLVIPEPKRGLIISRTFELPRGALLPEHNALTYAISTFSTLFSGLPKKTLEVFSCVKPSIDQLSNPFNRAHHIASQRQMWKNSPEMERFYNIFPDKYDRVEADSVTFYLYGHSYKEAVNNAIIAEASNETREIINSQKPPSMNWKFYAPLVLLPVGAYVTMKVLSLSRSFTRAITFPSPRLLTVVASTVKEQVNEIATPSAVPAPPNVSFFQPLIDLTQQIPVPDISLINPSTLIALVQQFFLNRLSKGMELVRSHFQLQDHDKIIMAYAQAIFIAPILEEAFKRLHWSCPMILAALEMSQQGYILPVALYNYFIHLHYTQLSYVEGVLLHSLFNILSISGFAEITFLSHAYIVYNSYSKPKLLTFDPIREFCMTGKHPQVPIQPIPRYLERAPAKGSNLFDVAGPKWTAIILPWPPLVPPSTSVASLVYAANRVIQPEREFWHLDPETGEKHYYANQVEWLLAAHQFYDLVGEINFEPVPIKDIINDMPLKNKRERLLKACEFLETNFDPDRQIQSAFVKKDERLALVNNGPVPFFTNERFADLISTNIFSHLIWGPNDSPMPRPVKTCKPRCIKNVPSTCIVTTAPYVYGIMNALKKSFQIPRLLTRRERFIFINPSPLSYPFPNQQYYYAALREIMNPTPILPSSILLVIGSGLDGIGLSKPLNYAISSGIQWVCYVAGDDLALFDTFTGNVLESDFSSYDATQKEGSTLCTHYLYSQWGFPKYELSLLEAQSGKPAKFEIKNSAFPHLYIKIKNTWNRPTGNSDTTLSNSLNNFSATTSLIRDILCLHHTQAELFKIRYKKSYGLEAKIHIHNSFTKATFLKGHWVPDQQNQFIWIPLPSTILKANGILTDPLTNSAFKSFPDPFVAVLRMQQFNLLGPRGHPILDPVRALIDLYTQDYKLIDFSYYLLNRPLINESSINKPLAVYGCHITIDPQHVYDFLSYRYSIEKEHVAYFLELYESALFQFRKTGSPQLINCHFTHQLAAVDYGAE